MRPAKALTCVLLAAAFLAPAGAAHAAVAGLSGDGDTLLYEADRGEVNQLTVSLDAGRIVFDDPGANIAPEQGCIPLSSTRVSCDLKRFVSASLADGDDHATTSGAIGTAVDRVSLSGDQGNDTLDGTADPNDLFGGLGRDTLKGGSGTAIIDGTEPIGVGSSSRMPPAAPEQDAVTCVAPPSGHDRTEVTVDRTDTVGGPCGEVLLYTPDAVVVHGTSGPDLLSASFYPTRLYGEAGDDRLFGTGSRHERLSGGPGDDRIEGGGLLLGGPGDDRLSSAIANEIPVRQDGGRGDDLMLGRYGNDRLKGGPGRDRISGFSGNDTIDARDGERDSVHCGDGFDTVRADSLDVVKNDCERVLR